MPTEETMESGTETHEVQVIEGGGAPDAVAPCEHGDGEVVGQGYGPGDVLAYQARRCPQTGATWAEAL